MLKGFTYKDSRKVYPLLSKQYHSVIPVDSIYNYKKGSINIGKESMKLLFPDSSKPPPHPFGFFHAKYLKIII